METLQGMKRTHHCGVLRKTAVGQEVVLCGWVSRRRDHGGLIFVDMCDRSGFVQVVFDEAAMNEGTFHKAESLRNEFCIAVRGKIRERYVPKAWRGLPIYLLTAAILSMALLAF